MMRCPRFSRLARRAAVPAVRRTAQPPRPLATYALARRQNSGPVLSRNGLADNTALILFGYDLERQELLHCNPHCQTLLGYSSQDLLKMGPAFAQKILHATSLEQLQNYNTLALTYENQPTSWDCRLRHRDGGWRWLRIRVQPSAFGPTGNVREIIGSAEDVSHYRAMVDELRQNQHLLRQVIDLVPNLVYVYDLNLERSLFVNQRVAPMLGYSSEELQAYHSDSLLAHLLSPESMDRFRVHLAEVARLPDGENLTIELSAYHRNGSLRWLRSTHAPFARDAEGRVISVIGVAEDMTERQTDDEHTRAATADLSEQHRLFRQIIDALPHPIYLKDSQGNYLLANRSMATLFNMTPEALVLTGRANIPAATSGDIARYLSQDQQVLASGQDLTLEESYTAPDGQVSWFSSVKRLFVRADGTAQILGVDSNITELKLTQRALEAAVGEAEVDAEAKENFLANMSHEIRTPLHGILGLTGVLAKTTLSRSQHDYLRLLGESAEHLLTVLNDVLTTARLGAGKLHAEATPFSPDELLMGCAALLRPRAREKRLRMRLEKSANRGAKLVLGDAHRLRQVLLNLVSNAIKFTETGQVLLRSRRMPPPATHSEPVGTVWLQFTVNDTGVGIAPETLEKIFEPFAQAAASTDREYGGSGLGLSISKGLVELMGGVLRVSSEVGRGSTFAFTLAFPPVPVVALPHPETVTDAPVKAITGRILLVEDNMVNSLLAETVLRNWGWQVTTAASGPTAIQLFEHRPFDLVLMDIQMPGMDGETAARALRQHPDPAQAATPIIALTARAQAGEAERLQANGFDGYLSKPYREEQLLETMQTVLAQHTTTANSSHLSSIPAPLMPSTPRLYDLSNVRQLVRNDETIVRRLAWAFIETTPAILTALDEALMRADWEAVGDAAHHLKSSLDGLGVEQLRLIIREIEAYLNAPPAPIHAAQQVAQVRAITERVMADLRIEFPE